MLYHTVISPLHLVKDDLSVPLKDDTLHRIADYSKELHRQRGLDWVNITAAVSLAALAVFGVISILRRVTEGESWQPAPSVTTLVVLVLGTLFLKTALSNIRERKTLRDLLGNPSVYQMCTAGVTGLGLRTKRGQRTTRRLYFAAGGGQGTSPHIWIGALRGVGRGSEIGCARNTDTGSLIFLGLFGNAE